MKPLSMVRQRLLFIFIRSYFINSVYGITIAIVHISPW